MGLCPADLWVLESRCGAQAAVGFPQLWLHLAPIHRLENGLGGGLVGTWGCCGLQGSGGWQGPLPQVVCQGMMMRESLKKLQNQGETCSLNLCVGVSQSR